MREKAPRSLIRPDFVGPPSPVNGRREALRLFFALLALFVACVVAHPALAQIAHHPFAVGANEGAVGRQSGLGAWILAQESTFYRGLTAAVRGSASASGAALLIGLSFAYGVFHAAGPGHGKAVITSYMVSNERALRRGLVLALLAALLQACVATAIIGIAAFVFDATAPRMTAAAQMIELASYVAIVALGLTLVWRKGRAVLTLWRMAPAPLPLAVAGGGPAASYQLGGRGGGSRFTADDGTGHAPGCDCAVHIPDAALLEGRAFDWKAAALAVLTAGARPCSGAILVLVFALSQHVFAMGVAATFAMALGTAITTGALAVMAVFAKDLAVRLSGRGSSRGVLVGRVVELLAAACVLGLGAVLLAAALSGVTAGA